MIWSSFYKRSLLIILSLLIYNSCKKESLLFKDDFQSNTNHWDTISTDALYTKFEEGHLLMKADLKNVLNYSLLSLPISDRNIIYSTSFQINGFYYPKGIAGIILYADDRKYPENYLLFGINSENEVVISYESKREGRSQIYYKQITQKYKKKGKE